MSLATSRPTLQGTLNGSMTLHVRSTTDNYPIITSSFTLQTQLNNILPGNAVWEDAESASRALRGLSDQPVALRSKFTEEAPQPMETSDLSPSSPSALISPPHTISAEQPEVKVQWHLGVSHPKANQVLLLRCAVEGDVKVSGAAQRSNYYRKYGNPNKRVGPPAGGSRGGSSAGGRTWREKPAATDLR